MRSGKDVAKHLRKHALLIRSNEMRFFNTILFLTLVQIALSAETSEPLERLRVHVPVDLITGVPASHMAGHYTSTSKEVGRSFLSGSDLYLFPDGSYIYTVWSDIERTTIVDKGSWVFSEGVGKLTSAPDVTWDPEAERTYLAVRRPRRKNEILLVGLERALPYFETKAHEDPEFALLLVAKVRTSGFSSNAAAKLKAKLIRDAWRPQDFKKPEQ
jgi:hypothetical protein